MAYVLALYNKIRSQNQENAISYILEQSFLTGNPRTKLSTQKEEKLLFFTVVRELKQSIPNVHLLISKGLITTDKTANTTYGIHYEVDTVTYLSTATK